MTTSDETSFPRRLTKIDELTREHHTYLRAEDRCYFLGEYTARKSWGHSPTNDLILNLKKSMSLKDKPQWVWKERAIREAAAALNQALKGSLEGYTFVPIPPSASKSDAAYDDRVVRILNGVRTGMDIRELVIQNQSRAAAHKGEKRFRPDEIEALYAIDERLTSPEPKHIAICDDMITTGCQYQAMRSILSKRFPGANFFGIFIARRVPEPLRFEALDEE